MSDFCKVKHSWKEVHRQPTYRDLNPGVGLAGEDSSRPEEITYLQHSVCLYCDAVQRKHYPSGIICED